MAELAILAEMLKALAATEAALAAVGAILGNLPALISDIDLANAIKNLGRGGRGGVGGAGGAEPPSGSPDDVREDPRNLIAAAHRFMGGPRGALTSALSESKEEMWGLIESLREAKNA